jgi:hypothetical protein
MGNSPSERIIEIYKCKSQRNVDTWSLSFCWSRNLSEMEKGLPCECCSLKQIVVLLVETVRRYAGLFTATNVPGVMKNSFAFRLCNLLFPGAIAGELSCQNQTGR